jgi:protein SCO1/2
MYSLTLKPEHDTPRVLREYALKHEVRPGWTFVTGRPEDMELLRRRLGFVDPDPALDADRSQHIGVVRYGNERFQRWAACPAQAKPEVIVNQILWMDGPRQA